MRWSRLIAFFVVWPLLVAPASVARADDPVVTTLADFEDGSVAVSIAAVRNISRTDCNLRYTPIPTRGQRALTIDVGGTRANVRVDCELRFRVATIFQQADRVAIHAWINEGAAAVGFRIRDAEDRFFETPPMPLEMRHRWMRLTTELNARQLRHTPTDSATDTEAAARIKPTWPLEIAGIYVDAPRVGRQIVFVDDLEVEHRVPEREIVRGEFLLDSATHVYPVGRRVSAAVRLENISRRQKLPLSIQLAWLRADGSELTTARKSLNLPASGTDYRSRQAVDFSQYIDAPGLYRLVARVLAPSWSRPAVFETTIAVTPTNRALSRGRSTFFGLQANMIEEPVNDRRTEIEVARELGVQYLALETPWLAIEPEKNRFDFSIIEPLVDQTATHGMAIMLVLTNPPPWAPKTRAAAYNHQALLFESLARQFGAKVSAYQLCRTAGAAGEAPLSAEDWTLIGRIQRQVAGGHASAELFAPAIRVGAADTRENLPALLPDGVGVILETDGPPLRAGAALADWLAPIKIESPDRTYWRHRAAPIDGRGDADDAIGVLRCFVQAARLGLAGLIWYDLRDDTADSRFPEMMRGLMQRDFSPRSPLLGYAGAVGMLHGLMYVSELPGTPGEIESAFFISANRQVATLFPKPNRVLPAVFAPIPLVPGELALFDFDRQPQYVSQQPGVHLIPTRDQPMFLSLTCERPQTDGQLRLATPWLRAPRTVFLHDKTSFQVEIEAPQDLSRSYMQVQLPDSAAVRTSFSARAIRAAAGERVVFEVPLENRGGGPFERCVLIVRVSLAGSAFEIPVNVSYITRIPRIDAGTDLTSDPFRIGALTPESASQSNRDDGLAIFGGAERREIRLAVALPTPLSGATSLYVEAAVEGSEQRTKLRIENLSDRPRIHPAGDTELRQLVGWRAAVKPATGSAQAYCEIEISARAFGLREYAPEQRCLLAVRLDRPAVAGGGPAVQYVWRPTGSSADRVSEFSWLFLEAPGGQ